MQVGTVREAWRYPVKSMQGERMEMAEVGLRGVVGDRGWAVRDETAEEIWNGRRIPRLLLMSARYMEQPRAGQGSAPIEIELPDGGCVRSDAEEVHAAISDVVGRTVALHALPPEGETAIFRTGKRDAKDPLAEARAILGLVDGEPFPDLSDLPKSRQGFVTAPGTYQDVAPMHLLTTSTLAGLKQANAELQLDVRRFRPNLFIDTGDAAEFAEFNWIGKRVKAGSCVMEVRLSTVRCALPTHRQPGIEAQPAVMRTMVRETNQRLGVYAWVIEPGEVRHGDAVEVFES